LTAQGQGRIQDYRIEFGSDGRPGKVTILNPSPIPLCVNLGTDRGSLDFSTPILSPMGDEMAITDNSTGHLIIVGINPKTGDCTKKEDLGIPTGKVHFSPDGRKIGFSTQALQMKKAKYGLANIPYLWDRDARTLTDLSLGDAKSPADVPYVGFLSNGNVIYQAVSIDERGNQKRYYAILDPKKMRSITIDSNGMSQPPLRQGYEQGDYQACVPPSQDLNAKVAIGRLWNQICGFAEKLTDTEAAFLSLRLTPHFCRKILNDHSDQLALAAQGSETTQTKDFMSSATRDQLKAACPTTELAKGKVSVKEVGAAAGKMPTVFGSRCMGCHTPQSPHGHIPWDRPEEVRKMMAYQYDKEGNLLKDAAGKPVRSQTKTLIQALSEGMREDHQPRIPPYGPSLTTQERKDILEWAKTGTSTSSGQ
jgi:hypothetical protein